MKRSLLVEGDGGPLGAVVAAANVPDFKLLLIFTVGTALMRSAGCAINDYADRDFDKHVKRTAERPLTSGKIALVP